MKVLFDVDDTLVDWQGAAEEGQPKSEVVEIAVVLALTGHDVYVSSGGGVAYARRWCERVGLKYLVAGVLEKDPKLLRSMDFDLSIDDEPTSYGRVNLRVQLGR